MPSYAASLTDSQIALLASYVASAAKEGQRESNTGFEPTSLTVEACSKRIDFSCYEQAFGNLAYQDGPKSALKEFELQIRRNRVVEGRCHPIAHMIGAGALLHFRGDVGRAFAEGSAACGSGYYHGLLEWKLADVSPSRVAAVARGVCSHPRIRATPFAYYQCVHGLGHGLMLYSKYDLPQALRLCHGLARRYDQVSCTGGVFMENQQTSYGTRSKWLKDDDLLYPCNVVNVSDKLYCYLLVTSRILPAVENDWHRVADWCRRADPGFIDICFQSFGRDASGSARQEPVQIHTTCALAGSGRGACIFGAARDILNNNPEDMRGGELCRSAPAAHRAYCFYGLGSILGTVFTVGAGRRDACARFGTGDDLRDCLEGARSAVTR